MVRPRHGLAELERSALSDPRLGEELLRLERPPVDLPAFGHWLQKITEAMRDHDSTAADQEDSGEQHVARLHEVVQRACRELTAPSAKSAAAVQSS